MTVADKGPVARSMGRWFLTFSLAACAALLVVTCAGGSRVPSAPNPNVVTLTQAIATLMPEGGPVVEKAITASFRWDNEYPGSGGRAVYQVKLPPQPVRDEPLALVFHRLGNQARISVNDIEIGRYGQLGDTRVDSAKTVQITLIPGALLRGEEGDLLTLDTSVQRQRGAGLGLIQYGPLSAIEPLYRHNHRWRDNVAMAYAVSLGVMGSLAAGLWWRLRTPLYGCYALAALFGIVRNLDRAWDAVPIPWPWLGGIVACCYALHLCLMARFVLMVLECDRLWLIRTIRTILLTAPVLAGLSFMTGLIWLWTAGLWLFIVQCVACMVEIVQAAFVARRPLAWTLLTGSVLALICGLHDLLLVRLGLFGGSTITLMPHALFFFSLLLGVLVVSDYSRTAHRYQALNSTLLDVVAVREKELERAFEALRLQQEKELLLTERARFTREIHDGVGSQLVGLLNLVHQPDVARRVLEEHVREALDEMRFAVDSLQPEPTDLNTMLATLRFRLQARFQAAGVVVHWHVDPLPDNVEWAPDVVLQVQRIAQEAFTNILKHAKATEVQVRVTRQADPPDGIELVIADNGIGVGVAQLGVLAVTEPGTQVARGIANMQSRAKQIGSALKVAAQPNGGTQLAMRIPLPGPCR